MALLANAIDYCERFCLQLEAACGLLQKSDCALTILREAYLPRAWGGREPDTHSPRRNGSDAERHVRRRFG